MKLRNWSKWMVMVAAAASLAACSDEHGGNDEQVKTVKAHVAVVQPTEVARHYIASGIVSSDHRIAVSSRISGYVRSVSVKEGQRVSRGQTLVQIDPVDARQQLAQARADLADADADLKRFSELLKQNAVSRQQFDKAELRYKVARSKVAQAKNQLSYADITSPVDGIVVQKLLNAGDLANPGSPLLVVEDNTQLIVETDVSEQYISSLQVGDTVDLHIPAIHDTRTGKIRQLVNAANPGTYQYHIKVSLDAGADIRPGMFAEVGFRIGQRQVLLVPEVALIHRAGLVGLYEVGQDGIARYRQVRLGERYGEQVEIAAGLEAGARIAWNGKGELATGVRVAAEK
jgi:RND family efflux transporter MFP subunit